MAEKIVSMHAAHRSGKDVVDGFLSRPMVAKERPAVVRVHGYRQRAVTRRFAQEGFVCLSPDLFSIIPRTRMRRIARRQRDRS
jgi:dienelactone hydrolase